MGSNPSLASDLLHPLLSLLDVDDDDELMLNVLRCHLTY